MQTLTADQLGSFFREARESGVYELYYLDLATGLRRGELLGLKWEDVDFDAEVLHIRRQVARVDGEVREGPLKTKNSYRTIAVAEDALDMLKEKKKTNHNDDYVFTAPTGGPISPDSVLHMLHRVLKRAGLPACRFHDAPDIIEPNQNPSLLGGDSVLFFKYGGETAQKRFAV